MDSICSMSYTQLRLGEHLLRICSAKTLYTGTVYTGSHSKRWELPLPWQRGNSSSWWKFALFGGELPHHHHHSKARIRQTESSGKAEAVTGRLLGRARGQHTCRSWVWDERFVLRRPMAPPAEHVLCKVYSNKPLLHHSHAVTSLGTSWRRGSVSQIHSSSFMYSPILFLFALSLSFLWFKTFNVPACAPLKAFSWCWKAIRQSAAANMFALMVLLGQNHLKALPIGSTTLANFSWSLLLPPIFITLHAGLVLKSQIGPC